MRLLRRLLCALAGHDDHLKRDAGTLYYACTYCGRRTAGWTQGNMDLPSIQAPKVTRTKRPRKRPAKAEPLRRVK